MAKNRRITIDDKRRFLELRANGFTIHHSSQQIGVCDATGTKLEKQRVDGSLEREILQAEHPQNAKDLQQLEYVNNLLDRCENELANRNIELLSTSQLSILYNKLLTTKQTTENRLHRKKTATTGQDDLDEIWSQVARAEGPK